MNFKLALPPPAAGAASDGNCTIEFVATAGAAMPDSITIVAPGESSSSPPRLFLDRGHGPRPVASTPEQASVDDLLIRALAAGLKVAPEVVAALGGFDRCLLSLLTLGGDKPMSSGRLAYLVSDLFDEISVNHVRDRLGAIRKHFASSGVAGLLLGDTQSGWRLSA